MEDIDTSEREELEAIATAGVPNEMQMREATVPIFDTLEELMAHIRGLVERPHSYGTCVYAMSHAAVAAFKYVARALQVTGSQAGCADLDILRHTRHWEWGQLLDYNDLLYPQYCDAEHFPSYYDLLTNPEIAERLAELARTELAGANTSNPTILAHWESLIRNAPKPPMVDGAK